MTQPQPKNSDLPVRVASAIVMVAVAGTALWLGGWVWTVFVAAVALGVLWEWWGLTQGFRRRTLWYLLGLIYVFLAASTLLVARMDGGLRYVMMIIVTVIATDVGAYFTGRAIGGPKIAPSISPSKTWAGLAGGALVAGLALVLVVSVTGDGAAVTISPHYLLIGGFVAIIAQSGDFFESWMKRRAGVKDSGNLIPGHGGLLDRVDGLLAVCFVLGLWGVPVIGRTLVTGGSLLPSPQ